MDLDDQEVTDEIGWIAISFILKERLNETTEEGNVFIIAGNSTLSDEFRAKYKNDPWNYLVHYFLEVFEGHFGKGIVIPMLEEFVAYIGLDPYPSSVRLTKNPQDEFFRRAAKLIVQHPVDLEDFLTLSDSQNVFGE